MARKIHMFFWETCANAIAMMPALWAFNYSGKYKFEMHNMSTPEGKKALEPYQAIVKKVTREEYASPIFVDAEAKKAIFVGDIEGVMGWLEGPEWWKKG
jgi:hypothetical protein